MTAAASRAYCAAVYSSVGSAMSIRWCGMPRRSAGAILSVPMSNPRYTAVESQLTMSPPNCSAIASASALFPVAVGPRIATTSGFIGSLDADDDVDDEGEQQDHQPELLRARHRGGVSL